MSFGESLGGATEATAPVALTFAVLNEGHGATDVGYVLAAETVPLVGLLLFGGVVADRFSRRLTMLGADVYVFSSEGEATLVRVLDVLCRNRGRLADVPNIAYRDGDWVFTPSEVETNDLVDHPVDYTLFRREDIVHVRIVPRPGDAHGRIAEERPSAANVRVGRHGFCLENGFAERQSRVCGQNVRQR